MLHFDHKKKQTLKHFKFVQIGFVDSVFYPMSKLNDVKNYPALKSYPTVFNNSILICLIISPLDRIGGCVWENWKKEKEIVTYKQVNSAMLVDDIAFFPLITSRVMTRISVRFVTYQSDHYIKRTDQWKKEILFLSQVWLKCDKIIDFHFVRFSKHFVHYWNSNQTL